MFRLMLICVVALFGCGGGEAAITATTGHCVYNGAVYSARWTAVGWVMTAFVGILSMESDHGPKTTPPECAEPQPTPSPGAPFATPESPSDDETPDECAQHFRACSSQSAQWLLEPACEQQGGERHFDPIGADACKGCYAECRRKGRWPTVEVQLELPQPYTVGGTAPFECSCDYDRWSEFTR